MFLTAVSMTKSSHFSPFLLSKIPDRKFLIPLDQGFSTSALLTFLVGLFFLVGDCPMYFRMFSSIPGLNLLDALVAASLSPEMTTPNVSRHF